jgi:hypothetical protein
MKTLLGVRLAALFVLAVPVFAKAPQSQSAVGGPKPGSEAPQRPAATEIWTDHLKVRTYPSPPAIAPGGRVALILEIEPGERMHVYAPGAADYQVITLTVAAQPFVRLAPMQYPASEIYVFEPLDERIPVYQKPFTLTQELILEDGPQAQAALRGKPSFTLTGTLDYQACDDRICFNPVSVPLSWTLALGPNVTRPPGRTPTPR